jgi:c-di-AMP phosphodiesterase-like protein
MFSYIKILDICEDNITVTINSKNTDTIERIREKVIKKFMDKASIIYKEDSSEDYFIVCKKQTCSPKLKNLEELENYFKNL